MDFIPTFAHYDPSSSHLVWGGAHISTGSRIVTNLKRESGVARPSSAATASLYTALVAQALAAAGALDDALVLVASTTATLDTCIAYEITGLVDGWDLVDPFALPNAIPSAPVTFASKVLGATGGAIALPGSHSSLEFALDTAVVMLGSATSAVVIIASESAPATFADQWLSPVGAAGMILRDHDALSIRNDPHVCSLLAASRTFARTAPALIGSALGPMIALQSLLLETRKV